MTPLITLKMALLAPIPSASVRIARIANPGVRARLRKEYRRSWNRSRIEYLAGGQSPPTHGSRRTNGRLDRKLRVDGSDRPACRDELIPRRGQRCAGVLSRMLPMLDGNAGCRCVRW